MSYNAYTNSYTNAYNNPGYQVLQPSVPATTPQRITGKYKSIVAAFCALTIPLAALIGVLAYLILHYRVERAVIHGSLIGLAASQAGQDDGAVFFVNLNPTFLMKIASLSTSIATLLTTFAVGLAVYPLAAAILNNTRANTPDALLTPYQYYLTIDLIENTGLMSVWRWLKYSFSKSSKAATPPRQAQSIGRVACIVIALGGLIFAAESWLHFTTRPFNFMQIEPVSRESAPYSRLFSSNCYDRDNTYQDQQSKPCTFNTSIRGGYLLNPQFALQVFNNISTTTAVNIYDDIQPAHAFLGIPSNGRTQKRDFVANTISVSAHCVPSAQDCNISRDNFARAGGPFTCKKYPAWQGIAASIPGMSMRQFTDASGTDNMTLTTFKAGNPYYAAYNGVTMGSSSSETPLNINKDPGIVPLEFGGLAYFHYCTISVYDVQYTAINGTITDFKTTLGNASVGTAIAVADSNLKAGTLFLQQAANLGAFSSNTSEQMADIFGKELSRILVATISGALQPAAAVEARSWSTIIVSRVPKAPLFVLIATILILIFYGVVLTVSALVAAARVQEVEEVRARLSLQHLVAERIDPTGAALPVGDIDDEFEECKQPFMPLRRIGVGRQVNANGAAGGWELKIWTPMKG